MPIYNYKCQKCDYESEELALNKDDLPKTKKCPKCGEGRMEKQASRVSSSGGSCSSCQSNCSTCGF